VAEYVIFDKAKAWSAHAITITGVIFGLLSMLALVNGQPQGCLLWLGAALIVDGLDGTLARKFQVKVVLPHFDGVILDSVIDYLSYVFIPALFIYQYIEMPPALSLVAVGLILVSSLYCFCNVNMKSKDNYFVGFPAAWNVVALYLFLLDMSATTNLVVVIVLAALTLTRMKFLHPFRVREFMALNIAATAIWLVTSALLIWQHPHHSVAITALWWLSGVYFVGVCVWRTVRGKLAGA
jgi:phosphatidylcholine synthase